MICRKLIVTKMNKLPVTCFKCSDEFWGKRDNLPSIRVREDNGLPCSEEIEYKRSSGQFLVPAYTYKEHKGYEGMFIADFTCPKGHVTKNILEAQMPKNGRSNVVIGSIQLHEFLFNLGISSFIDLYYRESIINFFFVA